MDTFLRYSLTKLTLSTCSNNTFLPSGASDKHVKAYKTTLIFTNQIISTFISLPKLNLFRTLKLVWLRQVFG